MRQSRYSKEKLFFLWEGLKKIDKIILKETKSTLKILNKQTKKKINFAWQEIIRKEPHKYDGLLWKYESLNEDKDNLIINVSPTNFSLYNILIEQSISLNFYTNPLGVTVLQETVDGYILLGRKRKKSDIPGLTAIGSGFIERDKHKNVRDAVESECNEETKYKDYKISADNANSIAIIMDSYRCTGIVINLPVPITHKEVELGDEHDELILLPNNNQKIQELLITKQYKGISAVDPLLGSLESYLNYKNSY